MVDIELSTKILLRDPTRPTHKRIARSDFSCNRPPVAAAKIWASLEAYVGSMIVAPKPATAVAAKMQLESLFLEPSRNRGLATAMRAANTDGL
jgi:hypothetical protein